MSPVGRRRDHQSIAGWIVLASLCFVVAAGDDTNAQSGHCGIDSPRVAEALARIRTSIDPCGESIEIRALLRKLDRCSRRHRYQICVDPSANRNVFDQPVDGAGEDAARTVTWNPELRTELEDSCDGDPTRLVTRDPTASLLHELVHAAQDCDGLNPGEHELEAVRIENIYRRAAGLCQRTGYGTETLPPEKIRLCTAAKCSCLPPPSADPRILAELKPNRSQGPLHGDRPE
jgi:hypothetical protein